MITLDVLVFLIWAPIFLSLWCLGVYYWFRSVIFGYKLKKRINILDSSIPFAFFIFFNKHSLSRAYARQLSSSSRFLKVITSFGDKKKIEIWLDNFMDVKAIRNLKDGLTNKYLDNIIKSISLFTRVWFLGFFGSIVIFLVVGLIIKIFNLPVSFQ